MQNGKSGEMTSVGGRQVWRDDLCWGEACKAEETAYPLIDAQCER